MPFKMVIVVINHWFLFQQKLFLVQFSVLINALHIHAWVYRGINQLFLRHAIYALLLSVLFALTFKIPTWRYNLESGLHIYETNGSFGFWLWRFGLYQVCTKNSRPSFRMALTFPFSLYLYLMITSPRPVYTCPKKMYSARHRASKFGMQTVTNIPGRGFWEIDKTFQFHIHAQWRYIS